jgi:O-antigen/teichoic acid export membrane protein
MLRFSLPLVANGVVGYLSSNFIDAYFLLKYLPVATLGVYTVGFQYAGALMQPATLAGTLLLPFFVTQLAHGREDRIQRYFAHALPTISVAWSLVCVTAGWMGATILPHLLGDQFREIGRVVWPLAIASAVAGPVLLGLGSLAAAQNLTYRAALASALAATANVVFDILWIPRFGMAGSAWATAVAYGCSALVWVLLSRRTCPLLGIFAGILPAAVAAMCCGLRMGDGSIFIAAALTAIVVALRWRSEWTEDWRLMREAWERSA